MAPKKSGALERIRTSDHQIRSLVLYPAELRARCMKSKSFKTERGKKSRDLAFYGKISKVRVTFFRWRNHEAQRNLVQRFC